MQVADKALVLHELDVDGPGLDDFLALLLRTNVHDQIRICLDCLGVAVQGGDAALLVLTLDVKTSALGCLLDLALRAEVHDAI